jgi:hypothetical protein
VGSDTNEKVAQKRDEMEEAYKKIKYNSTKVK